MAPSQIGCMQKNILVRHMKTVYKHTREFQLFCIRACAVRDGVHQSLPSSSGLTMNVETVSKTVGCNAIVTSLIVREDYYSGYRQRKCKII